MHSDYYAVERCPSVHLPVRCRHPVETANISSDFFSPAGSHIILVFPHQTVWQYYDTNLPNGVRVVILP